MINFNNCLIISFSPGDEEDVVPLDGEDLVCVVVLGHARHRDRADHPAERTHAVADAHLSGQEEIRLEYVCTGSGINVWKT